VGITLSSDGQTAFIVDLTPGHGLFIINVSDPSSPALLGHYNAASNGKYVGVTLSPPDGQTALIVDWSPGHGLFILDVSNFESPTLLGNYPAANNGEYVGIALSPSD
jgi:hypothetical protein